MANHQSGKLKSIRQTVGCTQAVIFLHGFSGNQDDTWHYFPGLLGTHVSDWDIFTLGYATTLLPDVVGVWSADPDLPILATMFRTEMMIEPLVQYQSLTFVAHSMGGLVVQRAVCDDSELVARIRHMILFGTPSEGLKKAWWCRIWKRQLRNMAKGSQFIDTLRQQWDQKFQKEPPFKFLVVAGEKDQFVPPDSSLNPFDRKFHRVVPGDHLSMVKPTSTDAESIRLLISTLANKGLTPKVSVAPLRLAGELPRDDVKTLIAIQGDTLSESEVVDSALALERSGNREDSIALLERYQTLGTDVQGTLAGRIKRLWLESDSKEHAQRALDLYSHALVQAQEALSNGQSNDRPEIHSQIYYHAINMAFLNLVAFDQRDRAKEMAQVALDHCRQAPDNVWSIATQAEANLYLGHRDLAIATYGMVSKMEAETWQLASTSLQASQIACYENDQDLMETLELLFTPGARRANEIFVSYSHRDTEWMERLHTILKPYLRYAEKDTELKLWVDQNVQPGEKWFKEIKKGLQRAGVAVVLVSADFLGSDFIAQHELPEILKAAEDGNLRILWVYLSPAAYKETPLQHFQAAHDLSQPLVALTKHEQDAVLLQVAEKIKEAALSATERFTKKVEV